MTVTVPAPAATATVTVAATAPVDPACDVDPAILDKFGRHSVRLSRAHEGSGFRVQEVLKRMNRGDKVKLALLGGSGQSAVSPVRKNDHGCRDTRAELFDAFVPFNAVSEGHGFLTRPNEYGAIAHDRTWHQWLLRDLQSRFGPETIDFVFGAKAATDSAYFSWCYPAHIGTDADLILVELAVNDDFVPEHFAAAETLLRSLLSLPHKPAVVLVDSFALLNARGDKVSLNGGDAHAHLALRYDVPSVSLRAAALTAMMAQPEMVVPWFNGDQRHIAAPLHEMLGALVAAYFQEEGCRLARSGGWDREAERWAERGGKGGEWPAIELLGQIPKVRQRTRSHALVQDHTFADIFPHLVAEPRL